MLVPKKAKYRKQFKGKIKGFAQKGQELNFGDFGLKAQGSGRISARQIEAARRAITHFTQRGGRVFIRIFPDKPVTKKPPEVGMGGGKGEVAEYVAAIKAGRILFEIGGVEEGVARQALKLASFKLPVATKFVSKREGK